MARRFAETARIDPALLPFPAVGIGGDRLFAAAERLSRFAALFLDPLEHLHPAGKTGGILCSDAEDRIRDGAVHLGCSGNMDELAIIGRIDGGGPDRQHQARAFIEGAIGLDRAPLVPEQCDDGDEHQQNADEYFGNAPLQARKPRCPGRFRKAHVPAPGMMPVRKTFRRFRLFSTPC